MNSFDRFDTPPMTTPADQSTPIRLAERVRESSVGPWSVFSAPTTVESVVSFRGSFRSQPEFEQGDVILQDLVVSMLDKGTRSRDRFQLAEVLDDTGAQLSIVSDAYRIRFSGKALAKDLDRVMDVLGEELREPAFDPTEFEKARAFVAAAYQREMENTGAQASSALSRLLYVPRHPNHTVSPEEAVERLSALTLDDVHRYYAERIRPSDALVVFCGDLDELSPEKLVQDSLCRWEAEPVAVDETYGGILTVPGTDHVVMSDKSNSDVRLGHPLELLRQDEDYLPLFVANFVLGGNFSARLMTEIRDRMGLTYGIWSSLSGITTEHSGHWVVGVTLSGENVDRGIEATRAEMKKFVEGGITAEELAEKQTTIVGSFKVGLATTGGMAASLLYNAERRFPVEYLDQYPDLVRALNLEKVNDSIRRHLNPALLSVAIAGPERATSI